MIQKLIYNLPIEIKIKITSYLYYSDYKSVKMIILNKIINNYSTYFLNEIYKKKNIKEINYHILKYYLYDVESYKKYNINYDTEISEHEKKEQIEKIFSLLYPTDIKKIYNYIMEINSYYPIY